MSINKWPIKMCNITGNPETSIKVTMIFNFPYFQKVKYYYKD